MSIARIKTWADAEILTHTDLNAEFDQLATNALPTASQSEMDAATSTTKGVTPFLNKLSLATEVATTSGVIKSFGVPSGTRRVVMQYNGVSTSGTSNLIIQIGDAGGVETTTYLGSCTSISGATPATAAFTTGFGVTNTTSGAVTLHGASTLTLEDQTDNTWTCTSVGAGSAVVHIGAGSKALSDELTTVNLTTVNGTDTFDAGGISVIYER